jgi:hypothetical protein
MDGQLVFSLYITRRFQKPCKIPLYETTKHIIAFIENNGYIFGNFSNTVTNSLLKKLISVVEIKKSISFHCARHKLVLMFFQKKERWNGKCLLTNIES